MVDGKIHQLNHQSVYTFNPLNSVFNFKHFVKIWSCSNLACIADETKLWSVCETVRKSLFWPPTCVPVFEYAP